VLKCCSVVVVVNADRSIGGEWGGVCVWWGGRLLQVVEVGGWLHGGEN